MYHRLGLVHYHCHPAEKGKSRPKIPPLGGLGRCRHGPSLGRGQAGHTIQPGPHRLATLDDLYSLATAAEITVPPEIKTAC